MEEVSSKKRKLCVDHDPDSDSSPSSLLPLHSCPLSMDVLATRNLATGPLLTSTGKYWSS
jgi:hypothetical protein